LYRLRLGFDSLARCKVDGLIHRRTSRV
jgi:hypothetical protein